MIPDSESKIISNVCRIVRAFRAEQSAGITGKRGNMSNFEEYDVYDKKDLLVDILVTLLVMVGFYAYWAFALFVLSLILLNIWRVKWEQILLYAAVLTVISMVVYITRLIKKRAKEIKKSRNGRCPMGNDRF